MTDLTQLSAIQLRQLISRKECSPAEVVMAFHNRITSDTRCLNAVVSLRSLDEVLADVEALDEQNRDAPLWGLPLAP